MPAKISGVITGSIAEELELVEGDELLSIDGTIPQDMIDYNYLCKIHKHTLYSYHLFVYLLYLSHI